MPRQVGAPGRHRLLARTAAGPSAAAPASTPARSSSPRCRGRRPRTGRAWRRRRRRRSRPSRTRTCRGRSSSGCVVSVGAVMRGSSRTCWRMRAAVVVRDGRDGRCRAGCTWCTPRRRGRWWPAAGRGCRAGGRRPRSRPRTAAGTARRRVRHRAVVLAELLAGGRPRAARVRRSSVPVRGQRLGQRLGAVLGGRRVDDRAVAARPGRRPGRGRTRRPRPAVRRRRRLGDEAQRVGGELVVRLVEGVAAAVGQREDLGGAAAAAAAVDPLLAAAPRVRRRPGRRGGGGPRPG